MKVCFPAAVYSRYHRHTYTPPSPTMHDVLAGRLAGNEAVCEANLPLSECGWHRGESSRMVPHWRGRALNPRGGRGEGGRGVGRMHLRWWWWFWHTTPESQWTQHDLSLLSPLCVTRHGQKLPLSLYVLCIEACLYIITTTWSPGYVTRLFSFFLIFFFALVRL